MFDPKARISWTESYLVALQESLQQSWEWEASFALYCRGELTLVRAVALVHPAHYEGLAKMEVICGPRNFPGEVGQARMECRAELLWGYRCPLSRPKIVLDHLFPYALGGPTIAENKLLLCDTHNLMKGSDLHVYPWERGEPSWLKSRLTSIASLRTLQA